MAFLIKAENIWKGKGGEKMIILSDCLSEIADEGCVKVAASLVKRIKLQDPCVTVISYDRKPQYSDVHLKLNKFFINSSLLSMIAKKREDILYIPFASNTKASAMRAFVLSFFSAGKIYVLFVLRHPLGLITKKLLELGKAEIIVLSADSYEFYIKKIKNKILYLKTGINTKKFSPVSLEKKEVIRRKYNMDLKRKILLHVGHLNEGRNVEVLLKVDKKYQIILVLSTTTKEKADLKLRKKFEERKNIKIIDTFCPTIEEIYQMSDLYLFPVIERENCIDVPLSVLEAAACNIPVICSDYGELKKFYDEPGFCFLSDFKPEILNNQIDRMVNYKSCHNREAVLVYDWKYAVERLRKEIK